MATMAYRAMNHHRCGWVVEGLVRATTNHLRAHQRSSRGIIRPLRSPSCPAVGFHASALRRTARGAETTPPSRPTRPRPSTPPPPTRNLVHEKYLTNGGVVEGVWLFHRHGDRAPNRCLSAPGPLVEAEASHWHSRIPLDGEARAALSKHFPPDIHPSQNCGNFLDVEREPFGFLTWRGMDQMRTVGQRYAKRYERYGHRGVDGSNGCGGKPESNASSSANLERRFAFLEHWDVKAFSTNYLRTVMSVQCFLDGLIGGGNGERRSTINPTTDTIVSAGGGLPRHHRDVGIIEQSAHADPSTLTTEEDYRGAPQVPVRVRNKAEDSLDMFGRYPKKMDGLVRDVIAGERFQTIDSMAAPLADRLVEYFPGLANAPQAFGGTPSGINWIHANDHFVCRGAHALPLLAFSDHEGSAEEKGALAELASYARPVMSHLAWRFREWYRCPRLLAAVAAPPLREVMNHMIATVKTTDAAASAAERRPFVMYSCHDVTILALLYAIGAEFLVLEEDDDRNLDSVEKDNTAHLIVKDGSVSDDSHSRRANWRWWPPYSSTLAFELVRMEDGDAFGINDDGRYILRVILNGKSVRLVPRLAPDDEIIFNGEDRELRDRRTRFGELVGGTGSQMMRLSDFSTLLEELDRAGLSSSGSDDGPQCADEAKLNLSGWKG